MSSPAQPSTLPEVRSSVEDTLKKLDAMKADIERTQQQIRADFDTQLDQFRLLNVDKSLLEDFLIRCYALEKPFALLLPITSLEGQDRQRLFDENGVEILLFDKRINFVTPEGMKASGSWFATAWFTWGLNIGRQLTFPKTKGPKQQVLEVC